MYLTLHLQLEAVLDPLHYSRLRFVRSAKHIMHVMSAAYLIYDDGHRTACQPARCDLTAFDLGIC